MKMFFLGILKEVFFGLVPGDARRDDEQISDTDNGR
jgi:hypothetical protein